MAARVVDPGVPAPGRRLGLALVVISLVVVAHVGLVTLGTGVQTAVEGRLPALQALAREHGVPVPPLLALAVAEGHRADPRPDPALARSLADSLAAHPGDEAAALGGLFDDPVERRLCLELLARNRPRWTRLAAR
ncbi:MAG: hypothetical protein R3F30_09860 [Planctomycetota bacterium]